MILQELFENRLSDIHAAYQEYLRIGKSQERADDFKNSWGMSPDTWVRRHQDEINKLEAHQRPQPVGDEHLIRGSAVPPVAEGSTESIPAKSVIRGYTVFYNPDSKVVSITVGGTDEQAAIEQARLTVPSLKNYRLAVDRLIDRIEASETLKEKQDACYHKVKSRYKVWPSAYASGALVQCRKKGAANWGTGGKKKE